MSALPWFRLYAEFAADPVIQALAFEDQRHYVVLLCLKCNGTLDRPMQKSIRERIIYRGLGLDPAAAAEAKRRLVEVNLIDDSWQPRGWDKRQFKSDDVSARTRKHRINKKTGNVPETLRERSGNGPDTDTDQDTEQRKNKRGSRRKNGSTFQLPDWVDREAWADFEAHRKAIRKPLTDKARALSLEKLQELSHHEPQRQVVNRSIERGWSAFFPDNSRKMTGSGKPDPVARETF